MFLTFGACVIFILAKKFITAPRLGHADFNQARKTRNSHLRYILAVTATLGVILFALIVISSGYRVPGIIEIFSNKILTGISIGVFFVVVFGIMAFLMDFTRAYVMGTVFGAGVASAMILDTAVFMVLGGLVFVIIGSVLFARFLKVNPLISRE